MLVRVAKCIDCSHEIVNECVERLKAVSKNDSIVFATNEKQLNDLCSHLTKSISCVNNFTEQCFNKEQRESYLKLTSGHNNLIRDFCANDEKSRRIRQEYFTYAECFKELKSKYDRCASVYTYQQKLLKNMPTLNDSQQVTIACCQFSMYTACNLNHVRDHCGPKAAKLAEDITIRMGGRLLQQRCSNFIYNTPQCREALSFTSETGNAGTANSIFVNIHLLLALVFCAFYHRLRFV